MRVDWWEFANLACVCCTPILQPHVLTPRAGPCLPRRSTPLLTAHLSNNKKPTTPLDGHPKQQPELLSRFIPADPWVGRVSLSSPQPPGGLPLPAAATATAAAAAKPGGGSGVASSTASPNPVANGTANNAAATTTSNTIGVSGSSSTNEHAGGAGGGGGAKGVVGLMNEGNWCYLNASLQALARCAPFRAHLVECVPSPDVAGRPW